MPLLLAILFGLGVYLLYEGLTAPARPPRAGRRLGVVEDFLRRAGLAGVTPSDFVLVSLGAGLVVGLSTQVVLGWPLVALVAAGLGALAPFAYYVRRHDLRRAAQQRALVEAIGQLRDAIRTGLSVPEALVGLARTGPDALRPEFVRLVREMRLTGFERAVTEMRDRLADPLFDTVCAALLLNDRLGGRNVSQVLDRLAHTTREQLRVQEELRAHQARHVVSARIVAAVPLVVLILIRQLNPRYLSYFDTPAGQLLLVLSLASVALGYGAMRWMARLPGEPRVLR
jgi:tight adherence protein B